mmetsp:Transcript_8069/g.32718  ORF Transcript_8069/g.32718 Transcript_8069/m.32718 type:complete len:313 (-) Transcript_8069:680-1618(-)
MQPSRGCSSGVLAHKRSSTPSSGSVARTPAPAPARARARARSCSRISCRSTRSNRPSTWARRTHCSSIRPRRRSTRHSRGTCRKRHPRSTRRGSCNRHTPGRGSRTRTTSAVEARLGTAAECSRRRRSAGRRTSGTLSSRAAWCASPTRSLYSWALPTRRTLGSAAPSCACTLTLSARTPSCSRWCRHCARARRRCAHATSSSDDCPSCFVVATLIACCTCSVRQRTASRPRASTSTWLLSSAAKSIGRRTSSARRSAKCSRLRACGTSRPSRMLASRWLNSSTRTLASTAMCASITCSRWPTQSCCATTRR